MSSASFVVLSGFGLAASDFTTGTHMSSRPWIASASSQSISLRRDRLRPRRLPGLRDPPHQGHRQELVDSAILNSKGWQQYLLQPSRKMNFIIFSVVLEKYVVSGQWKYESMERTRRRGKAPYGLQRDSVVGSYASERKIDCLHQIGQMMGGADHSGHEH